MGDEKRREYRPGEAAVADDPKGPNFVPAWAMTTGEPIACRATLPPGYPHIECVLPFLHDGPHSATADPVIPSGSPGA